VTQEHHVDEQRELAPELEVQGDQSCTIGDQIKTGIVRSALSQNLSRNIATLWPSCLS
jgi:hypothetical protein